MLHFEFLQSWGQEACRRDECALKQDVTLRSWVPNFPCYGAATSVPNQQSQRYESPFLVPGTVPSRTNPWCGQVNRREVAWEEKRGISWCSCFLWAVSSLGSDGTEAREAAMAGGKAHRASAVLVLAQLFAVSKSLLCAAWDSQKLRQRWLEIPCFPAEETQVQWREVTAHGHLSPEKRHQGRLGLPHVSPIPATAVSSRTASLVLQVPAKNLASSSGFSNACMGDPGTFHPGMKFQRASISLGSQLPAARKRTAEAGPCGRDSVVSGSGSWASGQDAWEGRDWATVLQLP